MKKAFWLTSLTIIFINMIIPFIALDYSFMKSIMMSVSVLAIVFMLYVVFFEKKTSTVIRTISIIFGLAGLTRVIFIIISLDSFVANLVLACILFSTIVTVFVPVIFERFIKE